MNSNESIKVWDIFIRFFHWSLVLTFFIGYLTEDDFMTLHTVAGYSIIALICLRLIWGFIGTEHARFKDFIYPLSVVKKFITNTLSANSKRYLGHNPAGGLMILMMLVSLVLTSITGVIVEGMENSGPFAEQLHNSGEMLEDVFEEIHEFFANFSLLLIFIHIAGVIVESIIHKENLIKSMVTGLKRK